MKERILLIDDDELVLMALEDLLQAEDFEVRTAANGPQGLAQAAAMPFDLVVLDIIMPGGLSGFEVCQQLRALPGYATVPIFLLSAKSDEPDRQRGLQCGANDLLPKPTDSFALLARIRQALQQRR